MTSPSEALQPFFTHDHRACDDLWGAFEAAADAGATDAGVTFARFAAHIRRHLAMEEEVLFPAFEEQTGSRMGPTEVMRREHDQMRGLIKQMEQAVAEGDLEDALDQGDTLLMLTQQHNQKEETILYPMAQQVLGPAWKGLSETIASKF